MINLKYWRNKRNLTQVQLAALAQISEIYIYEIEAGRKRPSLEKIYRLAEVLNVCPKELLICNCDKCKSEGIL